MKFLKSTAGKVTITILLFLLLIGAVFGAFCYYFNTRFFYGTTINGMSCEKMTVDEVKILLQENILEYTLTLHERDDKTEVITGFDLGMTYVDDQGVEKIKESQKPHLWFLSLFEENTYQVSANMTYNKNNMDTILDGLDCFNPEYVVAPTNAELTETESEYVITPETYGNTLNREKVSQLIIDAVDSGKTEVDFEEADAYEKPAILSTDETLNAQKDQMNLLTSANITYDMGDNRIYTVDRSLLRNWLLQAEDGSYYIDENQVYAWVKQMAYDTDTFGLAHEFTTSYGVTITLAKGGDYGWAMNKDATTAALMEAINAGTTGTLEPVYKYTAMDRGINDIGDTYVEICIEDQTMWCYKDGQLVVKTAVITGNATTGFNTPSGSVWAIDGKKADMDFKLFPVTVKYWLPFNGDVGIHDASWKTEENYTKTEYLTNGSHGCINTPLDACEKVFNAMEIGYPVIVYYSTNQVVGTAPTQEVRMG